MSEFTFTILCILLIGESLYLTFGDFKDGLLGRLASGCIVIGAFILVWKSILQMTCSLPWEAGLLLSGVVIFKAHLIISHWGFKLGHNRRQTPTHLNSPLHD